MGYIGNGEVQLGFMFENIVSNMSSKIYARYVVLASYLLLYFLAFCCVSLAAEPPKPIVNSIGMKMTLIPAGEFKMGSGESAEETAKFFNKTYAEGVSAANFEEEHPQHRVRITQPFYLGTYHVTRGQFRRFVKDTGYKTDAEKGEKLGAFGWNLKKKDLDFRKDYSWRTAGFAQTDDHPVVNVSWNDAVAFCRWLSREEQKTYRLPTEAEWEYACRAGTTTRYCNGNDPEKLAKVGNVLDASFKATTPDCEYAIKASDGYVFTAPVGSFAPNAFGVYDMHGNVQGWCLDWYGMNYYSISPVDDPKGPDAWYARSLRGGSWYLISSSSRSAARDWKSPDYRCCIIGFRVARIP